MYPTTPKVCCRLVTSPSVVVKVPCHQPEAFALDLSGDQARYLYIKMDVNEFAVMMFSR